MDDYLSTEYNDSMETSTDQPIDIDPEEEYSLEVFGDYDNWSDYYADCEVD